MHGLSRLFSRHRRYDDLSVSIREHIEERVDELVAEGMPHAQAEQEAKRAFGNATLIEQRSREEWQWPAIESLLADLRLVFRRIGKSPGFAATVLLMLSIGIGANTAVFSVINSVLLKPLSYPHSEQLVALWLNAPGAGGLASFSSGLQLSPSMYFTFSEHNRSFQSLGVWTSENANVTGLAQPEEVQTAQLSGGVLETLGAPPTVGRWFSQADQDPHGSRTVILSYGYWQRRFGGDRSVICLLAGTAQQPLHPTTHTGCRALGEVCDSQRPRRKRELSERAAASGLVSKCKSAAGFCADDAKHL